MSESDTTTAVLFVFERVWNGCLSIQRRAAPLRMPYIQTRKHFLFKLFRHLYQSVRHQLFTHRITNSRYLWDSQIIVAKSATHPPSSIFSIFWGKTKSAFHKEKQKFYSHANANATCQWLWQCKRQVLESIRIPLLHKQKRHASTSANGDNTKNDARSAC